MGTAFIAVADDPSTLSFNPAGITQLTGTQIYAGASAYLPYTRYESPSGESTETKFQVFVPPYFYICSDLGTKDLRVGLSLISPFGLGGNEWRPDGPTRYISTDSMITTLALNPTVAYQLLPNLSIAIGAVYMKAWNDQNAMVNQSIVGAPDGKSELSADGDGWGYNVGLLFKPSPRWSLGLQYRSSITVNYEGDLDLSSIAPPLWPVLGGSTFRSPIRMTNKFPDLFGFGIAFRPTDKWTIAFDAEYEGWSSFGTVTTEIEREVPAVGITNRQTVLDWENRVILKTGAEYRYSDRLALRAGYINVPSYVPDHTLSPENPLANWHTLTVGLSYRLGTVDIDFFYEAIFSETRTVENGILSGRYESFGHNFGFGIGKKF